MSDRTPERTPAQDAPRRGLWARLKRPPQMSLLATVFVGLIGGIALWGALNTGVEWTNRTEFCLSCHEMSIPYAEYKKTVHFSNRSGTTVSCADCHVAGSKHPLDYARKLTLKVLAARDVYGHLMGTIDTPEKYQAKRLEMAQRVWARMKEVDSKECRNCHDFKTMDTTKQKDRSVVRHESAIEDGQTCMDCHKGIAHNTMPPPQQAKAPG